MALSDESVRLANLIPTLSSIPRFSDGGNEAQVTIKRATLNIIPLIATGQTLEAIARDRGLARTLRDVAALVDAGIIWSKKLVRCQGSGPPSFSAYEWPSLPRSDRVPDPAPQRAPRVDSASARPACQVRSGGG